MSKIVWSLLFSFALAVQVEATSFDCSKSDTKVEKLICANEELSKLDEKLSESYKKSLQRTDIKQKAIESQIQWLKNVRNPCDAFECVKAVYETRIKEIELMASFGIVIMSAPEQNGISPTYKSAQTEIFPPKASVAQPKQEVSKPQVSAALCDKSYLSEGGGLTYEKAISKLIESAKAELELQQYECAIQALEEANRRVKSIDGGANRAAMGFEIKDAVSDLIQQMKLPNSLMENRAILAAVQSVEPNGSLNKSSSEDERFNDAAFYGQMADAKCKDDGRLIQSTSCEYKEFIQKMIQLDFSLPPTRHYVEAWRYGQYLGQLDLLEIANLWKDAPEEMRLIIEAALPSRLGQPIHSYILIGIELMSPEKARNESKGLDILEPAIERVKAKQSDFWIWWVYRYAAEAYWQAGDKGKSRDMLGKARAIIKVAKSAPAGRVNAYMHLATSLCKSIRVNGKMSEMCPIGIYDVKELSTLFDELEEMARAASDSYALGRVGVLRNRLSQTVAK